jgi:hypothetical protein
MTNFPTNILDEDLPTSEHRTDGGSPSNFNIHIPYKSLMKDHAQGSMKRVMVSHGIFATSPNIVRPENGAKNLNDLLIKLLGRLVEIFGEMKYLLLKVGDVRVDRQRLAEDKAQKIRHLLLQLFKVLTLYLRKVPKPFQVVEGGALWEAAMDLVKSCGTTVNALVVHGTLWSTYILGLMKNLYKLICAKFCAVGSLRVQTLKYISVVQYELNAV